MRRKLRISQLFSQAFAICVFQAPPIPVEGGGMRDALFQLFFVLAGAYGGIRATDDVKWIRERFARSES